jgi:hypothetical protein
MAGNALRLEAQNFMREFRRFLGTREALFPQRHANSTARFQGPWQFCRPFFAHKASFSLKNAWKWI